MSWQPVLLTELKPMQTVRVNGGLAVRIQRVQRGAGGEVHVLTELRETLHLSVADQLLRLEKAAVWRPAQLNAAGLQQPTRQHASWPPEREESGSEAALTP